jgi:hypothetical protein
MNNRDFRTEAKDKKGLRHFRFRYNVKRGKVSHTCLRCFTVLTRGVAELGFFITHCVNLMNPHRKS